MLNKHDAMWALPAAVDGCVSVVSNVDVSVVLDGVAESLGCVGVFIYVFEAKVFILGYDALELETTAKVFLCI